MSWWQEVALVAVLFFCFSMLESAIGKVADAIEKLTDALEDTDDEEHPE